MVGGILVVGGGGREVFFVFFFWGGGGVTSGLGRVSTYLVTGNTWKVDMHDWGFLDNSLHLRIPPK